ncbi:hypothetical protein ACROYT_G015225 [Oculina patagonica]
MSTPWIKEDSDRFWESRPLYLIGNNEVTDRRRQQLQEREENHQAVVNARRERFLGDNEFLQQQSSSSIQTPEANDLQFWCESQSWTYCSKCHKLAPTKLLPGFRKRAPTKLETACKCENQPYCVPDVVDVPLILHGLSDTDIPLLRPFEIHCGDYTRHFNGYRQRTSPFQVTWCQQSVEEKLGEVADDDRRHWLHAIYHFLMGKTNCAYANFVRIQQHGFAFKGIKYHCNRETQNGGPRKERLENRIREYSAPL